jgi:hypothetical protein
MNNDKTEVIWFGLRAHLTKLATQNCSLQIGSETIQPGTVVRVLGVLLDAELLMKQHIVNVATTCLCHLRRL